MRKTIEHGWAVLRWEVEELVALHGADDRGLRELEEAARLAEVSADEESPGGAAPSAGSGDDDEWQEARLLRLEAALRRYYAARGVRVDGEESPFAVPYPPLRLVA